MASSAVIRRAAAIGRLLRRRASAELPLVCSALGPARQAVAQVRATLEAEGFSFAREDALRKLLEAQRALDGLGSACPPKEQA